MNRATKTRSAKFLALVLAFILAFFTTTPFAFSTDGKAGSKNESKPETITISLDGDINDEKASKDSEDSQNAEEKTAEEEEVSYTVDFYYKSDGSKPTEYHMEGGSDMMLSQLFKKLGINRSTADIESIAFTDDTLVTFEKTGDDYKIVSHKPFQTTEKLTITFNDETNEEIIVEDAAGDNRTPNTEQNVNWNLSAGGILTIKPTNACTPQNSAKFLTNRNSQSEWDSFWNHSTSAGGGSIRTEVTKVVFKCNDNGAQIDINNKNLDFMFSGFTNLEEVVFEKHTSGKGAFKGQMPSLKSMFQNCTSLTTVNINSGLKDCSDTAYMQDIFKGCSNLTTLIIGDKDGGLTTRAVTSGGSGGGCQMQRMFDDCSSLKELTLENCTFDCGRTAWKDITDSFRSAGYKKSLETLTIKNCKFPGADEVQSAFAGCTSLKNAEILSDNPGDVFPDAKKMDNMFNGCTSLETLDVSGFGKLNKIENMDGFVEGCRALKTLNLDNLDNSHIGPTNSNHHVSDDDVANQRAGAVEFGRALFGKDSEGRGKSIDSQMPNLKTISAKKSKVWMVHNGRGKPGNEYYNAAESNSTYFFTKKKLNLASDAGTAVAIDSDRDYIDLITDRDGTNVPANNPEQNPLPDAGKNVNIKNGDINTNGAGFLAPGVYTIGDANRTEPEGASMCDTYYRIAYIGAVPYKVDGINAGDQELVLVSGTDNTYINTRNLTWPESGDKVIDRSQNPIKITYENAAIDVNGKKHDVVITVTKITFKDLQKIPTISQKRSTHDFNNYVPDSRVFYRPVLQAHRSTGVDFRNYVYTGDPSEPWKYTNCLGKGSGTDIDFTISIDGAPKDTTFVFKGEDIDVAYSQNWSTTTGHEDDVCFDYLPVTANTYGVGGEGFTLGDGNKLGTLKFADHTGLALVDGKKVVSTGSDPDTTWSEFAVQADAQGAKYTWTSGISCTTYALRNTKAQNSGKISLQPEVLKELINGTLGANQFNFELEQVAKDPQSAPDPTNNDQTKPNAADGKVTFDLMEFGEDEEYFPGTDSDGTHNTYKYTYTVKEVIPDGAQDVGGYKVKDGIIYDTTEHTVHIVIKTPENDKEMLQGIKAEIYVDKTPGAGVTPDKTYWHHESGCVDCSNGSPTSVSADKWYDENGNAIDNPNPIDLSSKIKFKNRKMETKLNIPVQKILQGRSWKDSDAFAAGLVLVSENAPMPDNTQTIGQGEKMSEVVINNEDTPVEQDEKVVGYKDSFAPITYTLDDVGKTYQYHVRELMPTETSSVDGIPGVTYDTEKYDVEVTVALNTTPDGPELVATATYKDASGNPVTISSFKNVYDAEETAYKMEAVKDYWDVAKDEKVTLQGGEFKFALKPIGTYADIAPMPEDYEGTGKNRKYYKDNEDDGDIEFEDDPDKIKGGMVFNYNELIDAGVDPDDLHSDKGVDFEYEIYELIPGTPEGEAKGKTLNPGETLVNNEDGTYSVIGNGNEIVYDGIHHTRKVTVKVIKGDPVETGTTVQVEGQTYYVYKDFNDVEYYEKGGKAYKKSDNTLYTPDLETLDVEGHKDDHKEDFYINASGNEVPMSDVEGYDPDRHHFKPNSADLGAPIFLNYRFVQEYGKIKIKKIWDDADNQDKIRPNEVTVNIKNNDDPKMDEDVKLEEHLILEDWTVVKDNLPVWKFDREAYQKATSDAERAAAKSKLEYLLVEKKEGVITGDADTGYKPIYDKDMPITFDPADSDTPIELIVTNKHNPAPGKIKGDETWGLKDKPQTGKPDYDVNPNNPVTPEKLIAPKGGTQVDDKTVKIPGQGTYVLNDDGSITFTPEKGYVGNPTPVEVMGKDKQGNEVTAKYTPHVVDPTEKAKVTRTVHFTYEKKNGKKVTRNLTQTGTITRKAIVIDPKTGKVTAWGPWSSYTFPAVKNPDKEAGPEWATKDVAPALTVDKPGTVPDVYIIYHKKSGSGDKKVSKKVTKTPVPLTGDTAKPYLFGIYAMVAALVIIAVPFRRKQM